MREIDSMSQSIHATTPSRIGDPDAARRHSTSANLSAPLFTNWRTKGSWVRLSTLTQNDAERLSVAKVCERSSPKNETSGGSTETELKEPTTIPRRSPSTSAVMMETPVG
ncbi:hypothetical protein GCM10025881_14630 [Pseudolysinimonas kribbensis]|uniref:Uncharacterized protein n=1 Tax=Pseudolysinimonas kribbensis TaxID=433641 RepID=A0ABQ6K5T2_9MICO|nr:hypothetical protein [Pseudolysinimonas kribbensis]GMA94639.1 hypothetical protein GCM10025881_14630 [Pseudolysinimonas kribbensis]